MSWKYSFRSILHWVIPFATTNWKNHPVLTIVTFAFHICLFLTPLFLLAHIVLWDEAWHISWWSLPDSLADMMTLVVVGACVFFFDPKDSTSRGSICHICFRLCDSFYCSSPVPDRIYRLSSVVQLSAVSQSPYSFRRNHAGRHPVYKTESYDILPVYTGVYGIGIRRCQARKGLVIFTCS